jgi:hypothetical protein
VGSFLQANAALPLRDLFKYLNYKAHFCRRHGRLSSSPGRREPERARRRRWV